MAKSLIPHPAQQLFAPHHRPHSGGPAATPPGPPPSTGPDPGTLRAFGDAAKTRQFIDDDVLAAIQSLPPREDDRHRLELKDVRYVDPPEFSKRQRKAALLGGGTLGRRVKGTWTLVDKTTGQVVDRRQQIVARVPHLDDMGTFIHNGSAYALLHQQRLRPGIYTRRRQNGEIASHVNVLPGEGVSHHLTLDPDRGVFHVKVHQARVPLVPLLKALGTTDRELQDAWGPDLFAANARHDDAAALTKLRDKFLTRAEREAGGDWGAQLATALQRMKLAPDITRRTLGHPYDHVGKDALLATTRKLLAVHRGEAPVDDRDHPAYQTFLGPEDLLAERVTKDHGRLQRQAFWEASRQGNLGKMPSGLFTPQLEAAILHSGLGQNLEEINSLEVFDKQSKISRMGEGGLPSLEAIPEESRSVLPGHLGLLDPVRTPESLRAGVDLNLASGARKGRDGTVYARFKNAKTGQLEWKSPRDLLDAAVAFPGWDRSTAKRVTAISGGTMQPVERRKVTHALPHMEAAFSPMANLVPFKSAVKAQRVAMGSRMLTQALPLAGAEAPLVRGAVPGTGGQKSWEEEYGVHAGAVRSEKAGRVERVDPEDGTITLRHADGTSRNIELYRSFPMNRKTLLHQEPVVEAGQTVAPGQLLARSNYTDDDGAAALGLNVRTAYVPWFGSITADTHVLWYEDGQPRFTKVSDVVARPGLAALATDPVSLQTSVLHASGFTTHAADKVLRIVTSSGRKLGATPVHSFVELGDDGTLREVAGSALRVGHSWLPRLASVSLPVTATEVEMTSARRKNPLRVRVDEDFGFICGLYVAEGCRNRTKATFAVTDPVLRTVLCEKLSRIFPGVNVRTKDQHTIVVNDARIADWFQRACGHLAQAKRVPHCMFGAPVEARKSFLAGFWVGDGRVRAKRGIPTDTDLLTTSRLLRDGLGLLMASLGISTTHGEYDCPACTKGKVYRLGVSMRDAAKMPDLPHSTKGERLRIVIASYKATGAADHVPVFASVRDKYRRCALPTTSKAYKRLSCQARAGMAARADILAYVPADTQDPDLRRLREIAEAPLEWDRVAEITEEPNTDWVYDFDMAPLRTFVCVDTLVVHNSNFEDATVISQSLADRMKSEHAYQHELELTPQHKLGKRDYLGLFPARFEKHHLASLDEKGIVKPGTTVQYGDPLILAAREKPAVPGRVHRTGSPGYSDATITWDHHDPGVVTDAVWGAHGPVVMVKNQAPTRVADKLAGRFGDKSVIAHIVPDEEMPVDSQGRPFEMLANPLGVISRGNPGQMAELWLGKIAAATGKVQKVEDFDDSKDLMEHVRGELARHGLSGTEDLVDPATGRKVPGVATGVRFVMKLHHTAESGLQARGSGGYSAEETPTKGGPAGCFTGPTAVVLADGTAAAIGALVAGRRAVHVRSRRPKDPAVAAREVVDWFGYRADPRELRVVELENGRRIEVTTAHIFYLADGREVAVRDLVPGMDLLE